MSGIREIDPEIADLLDLEKRRQQMCITLIAPINFPPAAIYEAQGSILTNAAAEGYAGSRYHGGLQYYEAIEDLAIERAKNLFKADHANVQPHSAALANFIALFAVLKPKDIILSMALKDGGHLSHGMKTSVTGLYFKRIPYHISQEDERIDYDEIRVLAREYHPRLIIAGSSTYPRIIDWTIFREIADEVGAYFMVDMSQISGLVAAGFHPSPVPYADFVTSSLSKTLRGGKGGFILCKKEFSKAIDDAVFPGVQASVIPSLIAAKAICFKYAMTDAFKKYIGQVCLNNKVLANELEKLGYRLVSGGTDNHIILIDLRSKGMKGSEAQNRLEKVGIVTNKNYIPADMGSATDPSGLRVGAAAMTSRGFGEDEFITTARLMNSALDRTLSLEGEEAIKKGVYELCSKYPMELDNN